MTRANSGATTPSIFKDFDRAAVEASGSRPSFVLGGATWTGRARLPFRKTSKMMAAMDKLNEAETTMDDVTRSIEDFFSLALIRSEREPFIAALNDDRDEEDDDAVMGFREVQKCMAWLMDHYMGSNDETPTDAQNGSQPSNGQEPTGERLKADSLQAVAAEVSGT